MNKLKASVLFLMAVLVVNFTKAQSMDEGKKFLYYERYKSAKAAFQNLVNANPANAEAAYWLGQAMIRGEIKDIAGAKEVYRKALEANTNNALLIAGMGHIELLEGKTQDARNRFETAISLSKAKDIAVLNAIGFANGDFDSKAGDAAYAVEKLKLATTLKGFKDPDVYTNLGDAYRKFADGGNALLSYQAALTLDPKYARAPYRIGRIYQTQGASQVDIMMQYYNQAIALDPNYAPVYYTLFQYNYDINVPKSAEYLDKYLAAMGSDAADQACYLQSSLLYAQGLFQQAADKAKACIAAGGDVNVRLYGIEALAYNRLNDSVNAKNAFETYFAKQKPELIGAGEKTMYAKVLLQFPGNETLAGNYIDQAVASDTSEAGKIALLKPIAASFEAAKQYKQAGDWYKKIVDIKKMPSKTDLYNAGYSYYRSGNFPQSNEVFCNIYTAKYPDDIFGYYMCGKGNWGIDTVMAQGLANPSFEKAIQVGEAYTDKSKIIPQLVGSYKYMIAYYANIKKDKATALAYADKALLVDPNDQELISNRAAIEKMSNTPPPPPRTTTTTVTNSKGEKVTTAADGTITTVSKDGTTVIVKGGKVTTIKNGVTTVVENGKVTTTDKNGKVTTTPAPPKTPAGNKKK